MNDFTQLPRLSRRRNPSVNPDKEIWQPRWRCFCCQDSGIVRSPGLVIEDYNATEDLPVVCQKPGCLAGTHLIGRELDERFTAVICTKLDAISREDWKRTVEQKFANIQALTAQMKMPGSRDRTDNDEREIQLRKQEIEAISHEEWLHMATQYSGGDAEDSSITI